MSPSPLRAGIVGCGTISGIYLKNGPRFQDYDIVATCQVPKPERPNTASVP